MLPSLFVSHGSPTLPLTDAPARRFLETLGRDIVARHGRPEAILVASAHWETASPQISAPAVHDTIHDFYGFPPALYEMRYPALGAPDLAARAASLLAAAGLPAGIDPARGLDHGAWVPLRLMFPDADIKVAQLSLQTHLGPAHHLRLGAALAPLRGEGVLILGSGSFTHDLSEFRNYRGVLNAAEPAWVTNFAAWFDAALAERRIEDLVGYRRLAPFAVKNHPTDEHLLPLYVAMGAGGEGASATHLHASATHGILRMDVYAFGEPDPAPPPAVMASAHHA
jgi:4,5-DOPA dioxygenase extradiol